MNDLLLLNVYSTDDGRYFERITEDGAVPVKEKAEADRESFGYFAGIRSLTEGFSGSYVGFTDNASVLIFDDEKESADTGRRYFSDIAEKPEGVRFKDYIGDCRRFAQSGKYAVNTYQCPGGQKIKQYAQSVLFDDKDVFTCMDMVKKAVPCEYLSVLEYFGQDRIISATDFLLPKDVYDGAVKFVLDVLGVFSREHNIDMYPTCKKNVYEVFGELLFGAYLFGLMKKQYDKFVFLGVTEKMAMAEASDEMTPAFEKNSKVIILSSSDLFSPYLGVCIRSILDCSSPENNYDIIVFERGITDENKRLIKLICSGMDNVSVRFFNVREKLKDLNFFVNSDRISQETYYGLLIPWFLPRFHKAVIMDCDMIAKQDLAELYDTDLGDNIGGGVRDVILQGWLNDVRNDTRTYYTDHLNAKDPFTFVNGGLILLDFDKYRKVASKELVAHYINNYQFRVVDQDIFNLLLEGRMMGLDVKWNHMIYVHGAISAAIANAPDAAQKAYFEAKKNPGIIHYASENKPWSDPTLEFAYEFWKCAKETPFYETILMRMLKTQIGTQVVVQSAPAMMPDNRTGARKIADVLLPPGSKRRKVAKFIVPKGSLRWRFCKQIYYIFKPEYRPQKVKKTK